MSSTIQLNQNNQNIKELPHNLEAEQALLGAILLNNDILYDINEIIDEVASKSKSIILARASYKEDLSDAREAIKQLGKYDLRKKELERQKEILKNKNDEISKKALKKIEKFETAGSQRYQDYWTIFGDQFSGKIQK